VFFRIWPRNLSLSGTSLEIDGLAFKRFKRKREGERMKNEGGRDRERERGDID